MRLDKSRQWHWETLRTKGIDSLLLSRDPIHPERRYRLHSVKRISENHKNNKRPLNNQGPLIYCPAAHSFTLDMSILSLCYGMQTIKLTLFRCFFRYIPITSQSAFRTYWGYSFQKIVPLHAENVFSKFSDRAVLPRRMDFPVRYAFLPNRRGDSFCRAFVFVYQFLKAYRCIMGEKYK